MFWNRVKALIKSQNTSQYWIAQKAGVSYHTFAGWISKKRLPDAEQTISIAKALNVTVEYLVYGEEGDEYVRKTLGIPDISKDKLALVKLIADMNDSDISILSATASAIVKNSVKRLLHKRK